MLAQALQFFQKELQKYRRFLDSVTEFDTDQKALQKAIDEARTSAKVRLCSGMLRWVSLQAQPCSPLSSPFPPKCTLASDTCMCGVLQAWVV